MSARAGIGSGTVPGRLFAAACLAAALAGLLILLTAIVAVAARAGIGPSELAELAAHPNLSVTDGPGFRAGVAGSAWLVATLALTAVPIAVGAGIYLEEYPLPPLLYRIVRANLINLAGVPPIVYGVLGLALFVRGMGYRSAAIGPTLLAGALTLGLMILPGLVLATQEALRRVPGPLREAALALGASRWDVVRDHVLPTAWPGILAAVLGALARALGEAAPLLLVGAAGVILTAPSGLDSRYTALPAEVYGFLKLPGGPRRTAAAGLLLLLTLAFALNAAALALRALATRLHPAEEAPR